MSGLPLQRAAGSQHACMCTAHHGITRHITKLLISSHSNSKQGPVPTPWHRAVIDTLLESLPTTMARNTDVECATGPALQVCVWCVHVCRCRCAYGCVHVHESSWVCSAQKGLHKCLR